MLLYQMVQNRINTISVPLHYALEIINIPTGVLTLNITHKEPNRDQSLKTDDSIHHSFMYFHDHVRI
jgi:hypothetical protein